MKKYSILLVIIAIGIFFAVIDPKYKEIKVLNNTKAENDVMLEKARQLSEKKANLTSRYNSISEEDKEKLKKALPETVDNVQLIFDIDNIAKEAQIVLRGFTVTGGIMQDSESNSKQVIDKTVAGKGIISLAFSFSAPYDVFKNFMVDLEKTLRIVDITDFTVTAGSSNSIYDYSIKLNTYWLR